MWATKDKMYKGTSCFISSSRRTLWRHSLPCYLTKHLSDHKGQVDNLRHWDSDKWPVFQQLILLLGRKYEHINRSLSFYPIRQVPFHFMAGTIISPLPPSFQWKVRRTLAFSIHELAVILGDQLTAADLVPIFNGFLKDLDEVRIGVLKHLYDFLKVRYRSTAGPSVFKCGREMNGRRSETLSR